MSGQINTQQFEVYSNLELLARQVVEGFITGLHKSPYHGFSVEFAEHRLYNTGESTRHIDWKLYGRSEKLFVKRYEEETNLRCQIVIDASSSMYFPEPTPGQLDIKNKLVFSIQAAASLTELLKRQRDAVGLTIFSDKIKLHTPARSAPTHHKLLYHEMEKMLKDISVDNKRQSSVVDCIHQVADSVHKRSLIVIFSDMMDSRSSMNDVFNALQHLRYNKHEVVLFHVSDKQKEMEFEYDNRPYRFVDLETGEEIKAYPNQIKENYTKAYAEFFNEIKLKAAQYKIDFVEADITQGYSQVLLQYLLKRESMI